MERSFLSHYPWRISYSSDSSNPITDFYIPALERSIQYDRKAGFFNSAILSKVARGLGAMIANVSSTAHPTLRLVMGCQFTPEDLHAIQKGYELRDALTARLDTNLQPPANFAQLKHFEILSWLIQAGYLEIRIAIPLKENGNPEDSHEVLDRGHLFHEKVGIFTDIEGNQMIFHGSNNESISGWQANIESFHVFCSWEGGRDLERVQEELSRFEQLWHNQLSRVRVFEVPEAVQQKLLRYAPAARPDWHPQVEFDTRSLPPQTSNIAPPETPAPVPESISAEQLDEERRAFARLAEIPHHPGCLDFCLKSIPITPWPHQIKILRRVAAEFPRSFLIADEVGLCKTIETGLILRYLLVSQKVKRVLVLAPASVQPQWQDELREKFNLHFWSYDGKCFKNSYDQALTPAANPWNTTDLMLASSHLVRRKERLIELLEAQPWDLVVLDEAHHARRKSPQQREDSPNRLLELMQQLRTQTRSLILLSATPMQIDPIEVFDLLHLLGLEGHWSYGENFCNYFASLSGDPNREHLDFWQTMSSDYFSRGGQPCPRFQAYLERTDRMLAYKIRDAWIREQRLVSYRQYLNDEAFITTSRQYLTINTPLKDLMFRHTRDTLRQYFRLGLLERDIATRQVWDEAIALEPLREVPLYQAVSDYVRNFYNLAQKENRKALGFLMTLYRKRLTSSFYAIQQSLQRRLDGISITPDDLSDLDDADDAILEGLDPYIKPVDPKEIEYLESLLRQFENTGEDTKLSHFINTLRQELIHHESAIAFTQYTDTMDYLRDTLRNLYGSQVACYSGRGGELYEQGGWKTVPKEAIKHRFRTGDIKILLCTESASEGLNLQTCGVLFNYDLPWNPMRVEQRIGRIDRIGQVHDQVNIHNFYYDGTVEAKVYRKLRDRINAFTTVVGNLQPILAQVPTFIEQAAMSADPQEEDVLLANFDHVLDTPPLRPALDDMVAMDVQADLEELRQPLPPTLFTPTFLEKLFTSSALLKGMGFIFEPQGNQVWRLTSNSTEYWVTFYPDQFDAELSLRLMSVGEPLFDAIMDAVLKAT
ncbi:MAG: DEAD/DEAH box helicase [Elainellaceae cyanobacterium]